MCRDGEVQMVEELYRYPRFIERAKRSWLKEFVDAYLNHLAAQGYSLRTRWLYASRLIELGEFMARQEVKAVEQLPQWIDPFLEQRRLPDYDRRKWQLFLGDSSPTCARTMSSRRPRRRLHLQQNCSSPITSASFASYVV